MSAGTEERLTLSSSCWGESRAAASLCCLYRNQRERAEWKHVQTLCNHFCLGFELREESEENNDLFLDVFLQWLKGDVRLESDGNGRLSERMWWGAVECYLREIKQDPARRFIPAALKAPGNPPRSACEEHTGRVREGCCAWRYPVLSANYETGRHVDSLTDWPRWIWTFLPCHTSARFWKIFFFCNYWTICYI